MSIVVGIIFAFLLVNQNVESLSRVDPLVNTKVGLIRGLQATDGDYSMFMGIPYGIVDEANPFGPSTPYAPFNETFEAYDNSAICPQSNLMGETIDCLHLSIYVPSTAQSDNLLPVFVWIHGGAFQTGSSGINAAGPKFIVRHDVILVTLNYRVGVYGFLCLGTPEVPGNQGLKDQRLALRWIKNNIEAFGGDVNRMTLTGVSAGGKSVDYHLHLTKEIEFQSYILQSGTVLLPHLEKESDSTAALQLANIIGFNTTNLNEAFSFLAAADFKAVIDASFQIDRFQPCYEKKMENEESFLTDYSINLNTDNIKGKNIILGFSAEEWLSRHAFLTDSDYATWNGFHKELSHYFDFEEEELKEMTDVMRHFYIGDENISEAVKFDLIAFDSDFLFNYPCERSIDKFVDSEAGRVYYYLFSYVGNRNWVRFSNNITIGGATHADEIGYLFDISQLTDPPTAADQLMIDRMTKMWTNFVKYGDPTPETSELLPIKWEPITSKDSPRYYLELDSELKLGTKPLHDRMSFWELFYKRNKELQRGYRVKDDAS